MQIVVFLYHMSELRRFNDALLMTLDEINYFRSHQCDILFDTLHSEFFNEEVSKHVQLLYISFLGNICWSCHAKIGTRFNQNFDNLCRRLVPSIEWENLINTQERSYSSLMMSSFKSKSYEHDDSFLKKIPIDSNYDYQIMIPFISLVKLCKTTKRFKKMIQDYSIIERIYCKVDVKNNLMGDEDTARSFTELESCLFKTFKKYTTKFDQLDEIS